ncbi:hypothetical protein MBLNU459_g4707t1 [Dothideomycetes sp. NU459]
MTTTAVRNGRPLGGANRTARADEQQQCTPFILPSGGVLSLAADNIVTLTTSALFQPACTGIYSDNRTDSDPSSIADLKDPFYASTIPQTYVIAVTTAIAWILVVMLTINPRTFYMGGPGGATNFASGRGLIGGATGASSSPGVGSRPWLQKVAALAVAISLTIATADTFKVAERQYLAGYMDATLMRDEVEGSLEIRITRVISDIFLWLAQVQTLIRLFPRHKEKVLIKWIGFALIILDTTFSCLNSFMVDSYNRPRHFVDAIPALSYLFELAVGLLYAAWVIFYGLTKRRYAYYHPKMKNITLVALIAHIAILTPVVFFVTDVSEPDVAAWGDYFRWVGAAAASVVVWEWVERIEALERDEKKDGILGREIFDGDEMLDLTPSGEMTYTRKPRDDYRPLSRTNGGTAQKTGSQPHGLKTFATRRKKQPAKANHFPLGRAHSHVQEQQKAITFGALPRPVTATGPGAQRTPPPPRVTPPSRTDTTSAASTVYVVNYNGYSEHDAEPVRRLPEDGQPQASTQQDASHDTSTDNKPSKPERCLNSRWQTVHNPFKRKRLSPPAEVRAAIDKEKNDPSKVTVTTQLPAHSYSRWDIKSRLGVLAAEQGERFRERASEKNPEPDLPWTVIPVQPRGAAAWSPSMLNQNKTSSRESSHTGTSRTAAESSRLSKQRDSDSSQQMTWSSATAAENHREGVEASPARASAAAGATSPSPSSSSSSSSSPPPPPPPPPPPQRQDSRSSSSSEAGPSRVVAPERAHVNTGQPETDGPRRGAHC